MTERRPGDLPLVVYWNNIPAPWFVERFNALADSRVLTFEAWYNDRALPHRSWHIDEADWSFRHRYLPKRRLAPAAEVSWAQGLLAQLRPQLLVSLFAEPSFVLGWMAARRLGIKTAFRLLAPSDSWFPRTRTKELLKHYMFSRVDGVLVAGDDAAAYARSYGVRDSRIFLEPQVSDAHFFASEAACARQRRDQLRADLGVSGTVFVYLGRLWWGKGVADLIDAFALTRQQVPDATLLLVGDGNETENLHLHAERVAPGGVIFAGFRQRPLLPSILAASDVFVFPTLGDPYGLVVDEAMAAGLPVISTSAAGEISVRVRDGETGYVVPPREPALMARRMVDLALDAEARARMGSHAAEAMEGRTPAFWAERFEAAALSILGGRPLG